MTSEQAKILQIAKEMPNDDLTKKPIDWKKISKATKEWLNG